MILAFIQILIKNGKSTFIIENPILNRFLKIIGAQNQLPITFCSDLMSNITLKARNSTPKHEFLNYNIPITH